MRKEFAEKLSEDYYLVSYTTNRSCVNDEDWIPPRFTAVQLSAAITAYARIFMFQFLSRSDCLYTDTDSIVIRKPLPVSSTEIGKFKLVSQVRKGIFMAPKSYDLELEDDTHLLKHKGPAKDLVTSDWFVSQLKNLSQTKVIQTEANFRIDWGKMDVLKKNMSITLGPQTSTKRQKIFNKKNVWVDTRPIEVIDLGTKDATMIFKKELIKVNDEKANEEIKSSSEVGTTTLNKSKRVKNKDQKVGEKKQGKAHPHTSADRNRIHR